MNRYGIKGGQGRSADDIEATMGGLLGIWLAVLLGFALWAVIAKLAGWA